MTVFVCTPLHETHQALLQSLLPAHIKAVFKSTMPEQAAQSAFEEADFIMGNPPAAWWNSPPASLQFWQLDSAGFDGYQHLTVRVPVCNMGDYFAWPCAETIVAGIMGLYRRIDALAVLQTQKKWIGVPLRFTMKLLHQQSVIILGAGTIGSAVKSILLGFGCEVQVMARTNPFAQIHTLPQLQAALPTADLVVNCLPGTAKDFFSAALIGAMKKGSVFANVGRGSTVDEAALIAALQSGHLGGAVLDTTLIEPLPTESPLWELPNVVLTQHTAGGTITENEGKVRLFADNLQRFLGQLPLKNQIDLTKGY